MRLNGGQPTPVNAQVAKNRLAGRHPPSWALFFAVMLIVLAGDLITKSLAFEHVAAQPVVLDASSSGDLSVPPHDPISLVPYVLSLKLTINTGAVFGQGKGLQVLFMVVSVVAAIVVIKVFASSDAGAYLTHVSLALIMAGALGNLHDRIQFNAVRDLLWLFPDLTLPFGLQWPGGRKDLYPWIFNVADVALVVGVVLMLIIIWRGPKGAPANQTDPD